MKQILTVITLLIFSDLISAQQFNLTAERNFYRPSDRIVKQKVDFKDPGSCGRNLTWDFSMLQSLNDEYKLDYSIPDSICMDTLCGMEHNTRYYYYQKRDTIWGIGFENSTTLRIIRNRN